MASCAPALSLCSECRHACPSADPSGNLICLPASTPYSWPCPGSLWSTPAPLCLHLEFSFLFFSWGPCPFQKFSWLQETVFLGAGPLYPSKKMGRWEGKWSFAQPKEWALRTQEVWVSWIPNKKEKGVSTGRQEAEPALTHTFCKQTCIGHLLCARCCVIQPRYNSGGDLVCWLTNPFLALDTEKWQGRRRNLALAGRNLGGHPHVDPWWGLSYERAPSQTPKLFFSDLALFWSELAFTPPDNLTYLQPTSKGSCWCL